jgi:hypothetical protein
VAQQKRAIQVGKNFACERRCSDYSVHMMIEGRIVLECDHMEVSRSTGVVVAVVGSKDMQLR